MSVRRLAEDSVQPAGFAFSGENEDWAARTIQKYPEGRQQSAVIPLLMRAQDQDGWVTKAAIEYVAGRLGMPLIRVLEVATFYTQFQLKPVGTKAHIQVCGTTPCMLRGSDALKRVCQSKIHAEQFHLNASGTLSWEEVECLGACVNAPMVMVFKDTYEDLTPERLEAIIEGFENGDEVRVGPQIDRHLSAPEGGPTTLIDADDDGEHESSVVQATLPEPNADTGAAGPQSQAGRTDTDAAATGGSSDTAGAGEAKPGDAVTVTDAGVVDASGEKIVGEKPSTLLSAPEGAKDDLQAIKGIGPVIEAKLNALGIFHFRQIAAWSTKELVWIDDYLNFRGRAVRENWVNQAAALGAKPASAM